MVNLDLLNTETVSQNRWKIESGELIFTCQIDVRSADLENRRSSIDCGTKLRNKFCSSFVYLQYSTLLHSPRQTPSRTFNQQSWVLFTVTKTGFQLQTFDNLWNMSAVPLKPVHNGLRYLAGSKIGDLSLWNPNMGLIQLEQNLVYILNQNWLKWDFYFWKRYLSIIIRYTEL
jgi:hypothetical protein